MAFLQRMDEVVPWKEIRDEIDGALFDRRMGHPGFSSGDDMTITSDLTSSIDKVRSRH